MWEAGLSPQACSEHFFCGLGAAPARNAAKATSEPWYRSNFCTCKAPQGRLSGWQGLAQAQQIRVNSRLCDSDAEEKSEVCVQNELRLS